MTNIVQLFSESVIDGVAGVFVISVSVIESPVEKINFLLDLSGHFFGFQTETIANSKVSRYNYFYPELRQ
jgi:hypothetical protein